jgi:hypothetical protein
MPDVASTYSFSEFEPRKSPLTTHVYWSMLSTGEGGCEMNELNKAAEYLDYGRDCVRLADAVESASHRTMLLHIAETWLRLAEDLAKDFPSTRLH